MRSSCPIASWTTAIGRYTAAGGEPWCGPIPISINVEEIRRIANSPRALEYEKRLQPLRAESTIVRVDRAEPSKNVVRGFKAFGSLLSRYP